MSETKELFTTYVGGEGRDHLGACMEATFQYCRDHAVSVLVIYTATGDGPALAVDRFLTQPQYANIRVVAVTPPANRTYVADSRAEERTFVQTGIFGERQKQLSDAGVSIVSARLPFRPLTTSAVQGPSGPTDPMQLVDRAFGVLGGGFSFCIQAVLMACDAGAVTRLERVAAMSADTALVVIASQSESFFSADIGLLVEHIICRPSLYDISKQTHFMTEWVAEQAKLQAVQAELPLESTADEVPSEDAPVESAVVEPSDDGT